MKNLFAGGFLVLCMLFLAEMGYIAVAASAPPCEFGACMVKPE
jgi:hypothetical protein